MTVKVSDHLYKKSIMRDMSGNIINMIDETNGGYIIRNRQIVNPERWNEIVKAEKDKQEAAKAIAQQVENPNAHLRNQQPVIKDGQAFIKDPNADRMNKLESKVEGMEDKLDKILNALNK